MEQRVRTTKTEGSEECSETGSARKEWQWIDPTDPT
jgi:hypothetical protein